MCLPWKTADEHFPEREREGSGYGHDEMSRQKYLLIILQMAFHEMGVSKFDFRLQMEILHQDDVFVLVWEASSKAPCLKSQGKN